MILQKSRSLPWTSRPLPWKSRLINRLLLLPAALWKSRSLNRLLLLLLTRYAFSTRVACISLPFDCVLILFLCQNFDLSQLLSFDPASIGLTTIEAERETPQPTVLSSQLQHIKDLLSSPIDALVRDSGEVRSAFEEIRLQLLEAIRVEL